MSEFAWLIEAPGQRYLGTREIGHYPDFHWTTDHAKATRFYSREQADGVMMAVRRMEPSLFAFAVNLGDARPTEHGWIDGDGDAKLSSSADQAGAKSASILDLPPTPGGVG